MKIRAYQEIYLNSAQKTLGDAFDCAVNVCKICGGDFANMFIVSSISRRMELGEPACLAGTSGAELVRDILFETKGESPDIIPVENFHRSCEYWIGWAIAYYQWYSGRKYKDIFSAVPYHELEMMYVPLHEADMSKFADIMESRMREHFPETNIKRLRLLYGYTQEELATQAGVGLRSIQMYEQRNKNINKASADTVYRLSKVLGCTMEDLLEFQVTSSME